MTDDTLNRSGSHPPLDADDSLAWAEGSFSLYNAAKAAKDYRDERTPDQRRWDKLRREAEELAASIYTTTQGHWLGGKQMYGGVHPMRLEDVRYRVRELDRVLSQLSIIGFREGDPVPKIEAPKPIETEVSKLERAE